MLFLKREQAWNFSMKYILMPALWVETCCVCKK